jgi:tetratricopeptide (TPR) repeat protein
MSSTPDRLAQLRRFLAMDPANTQLACDLIDSCLAMGEYAEADRVLAELPAEAQMAAGILFRRARNALIHGRYAEAADVLQGLIAEGHENVALWHDLAFAQLCQRQTADANETLMQAVERFGDNPEIAIVAARVAMMDGDFVQALARLEQARAMAPEHATVLGLRSLALLDSGENEAGYAAAIACLDRHPDQHEALLVAGTVALWRQHLDEADAHFVRALSRHPNSGRALSGVGQVRMLQNRLPDALQELRHAVVAMPDHIGTWHALAWTELLLGDVDAAETSYERAYDLDRNFADSHGGLALIHALRGRREEAELAIKRALRLNPECPTALYARTLLLEDSGQGDEAMKLLGGLVQPLGLPAGMDIADFSRKLRARFGRPTR